MKRLFVTVLNFILFIIGFLIIYSSPWSPSAIAVGMFLISVSIISFTVLIYFPPKEGYIRIKVVEESPRVVASLKAAKTRKKPQKSMKTKKKSKKRIR